jgi:hypothetical protein
MSQNSSTIKNDLFDNPMVSSAIKSLSDEQLLHFKEVGEHLYGNVDFEGSRVLNSLPAPMSEAVSFVLEGIKSGLHPSDLTDDEKAILKDTYGENWYIKWGYTKEDLDSVVTLDFGQN